MTRDGALAYTRMNSALGEVVSPKPSRRLRSRMSPASRARAEASALAMLAEMPLNELRQARGLSQKTLAEVLNVQQPSIAKLEKRTDMYLSTLRNHTEAMGGQLDVVARFPDGAVKIGNFSDLEGNTAT
jgi:ribosome-binding protein aMBF1 (putative translation factor)